MKKFLLGAVSGLAVYKIIRSKNLKARITRFNDAVIEGFLNRLLERAMKNGITDTELADLNRIVEKFLR